MGRVETEGCFLRRGSSLAACAAANCGQWGNWRHALACPPQMWPTSFDELRGGTRGRLKFHNFRRTPPRAFLVSKPEVQRAVANLYRPTLEADVEDYFRTAPADELVSKTTENMTIVRRFALGLVRANKAKGSVKTRRKTAGWSPDFLLEILQLK